MTVRRSRTWGSGPAHDRRPFFAPRRRGASSGIGEASPGRPGGTRRLSPGLPHPARDCCARRNNRACSACTGNGCPAHGVAPSKRPAIFTRSCSGRSVPGTEGRVARSRILRDLATNGRRGCRPRGTRGIRRPDAEPAATVSCPDLWGRSAYRAVNGFALGVCSSRPNPVAVAIGAAGSSPRRAAPVREESLSTGYPLGHQLGVQARGPWGLRMSWAPSSHRPAERAGGRADRRARAAGRTAVRGGIASRRGECRAVGLPRFPTHSRTG